MTGIIRQSQIPTAPLIFAGGKGCRQKRPSWWAIRSPICGLRETRGSEPSALPKPKGTAKFYPHGRMQWFGIYPTFWRYCRKSEAARRRGIKAGVNRSQFCYATMITIPSPEGSRDFPPCIIDSSFGKRLIRRAAIPLLRMPGKSMSRCPRLSVSRLLTPFR